MYLTKINCDLHISSPLPPSILQPQTEAMYQLATVHRKKSTRSFVVHVTKDFSNKSSCEVKIEKHFLVLNSNDNGTVEMSDVCLALPSPAIRAGGTNCTAKT